MEAFLLRKIAYVDRRCVCGWTRGFCCEFCGRGRRRKRMGRRRVGGRNMRSVEVVKLVQDK